MSHNAQTWKLKQALLHNEEPCLSGLTLKNAKLLPVLISDETKNSQGWINFLFWEMMTSHQYQGFNIILAHAREEAKNEVSPSKIFIYDHYSSACGPLI